MVGVYSPLMILSVSIAAKEALIGLYSRSMELSFMLVMVVVVGENNRAIRPR